MSEWVGKIISLDDNENSGSFLVLLETSRIMSPEKRYVLASLDGRKNILWRVEENRMKEITDTIPRNLDWFFGLIISRMLGNAGNPLGLSAISNRTDFYPFQLRPLLKYFQSSNHRLLIADDVGIGKTVEACYILMEELNRRPIERVLILCPSHLKRKWQWELYTKFGVGFTYARIDDIANMLRDGTSGFFIASLDCANSESKQTKLHEALSYDNELDLLIIDEIHHCIGRGGDTFRRKLGMTLSSIASGAIVLSASPVQIEIYDLKRVLDLLLVDEIPDDAFLDMMALVKPLNRIYSLLSKKEWDEKAQEGFCETLASLRLESQSKQLAELLSDLGKLSENSTLKERIELRREVWNANPLTSYMTRTRKKEVNLEIERNVCDICIDLSTDKIGPFYKGDETIFISEKELFDDVQALFRRCFSHVHLRQLSSSLPAVRELVEEGMDGYSIWKRKNKVALPRIYYDEETSQTLTEERITLSESEREECKRLVYLFRQVESDSKWKKLVTILGDLKKNKPDRKVVVFTHWIPTLDYFQSKRSSSALNGINVFVLNASRIRSYDREKKISEFQSSKGFGVLFCSDVLSEGIDLYEADTIINYDLPYNPQRLEQRIGRIDRIKQKASVINIYNIYLKDSIDQDILRYLRNRIGYFKDSIGDMGIILESDDEEWASIDEEEIAKIERKLEIIRDIEKSGALTVLDDMLDSRISEFVERADCFGSKLRWLPIVNYLSLFKSNRLEFKFSNDTITIKGIESDLLEIVKVALGSQDGESVRIDLTDNIQEGNLTITLNPESEGWFPHIRNPFMKYVFKTMDCIMGINEKQVLHISYPESDLKFSKLELVSIHFKGTDFEEVEWGWWEFEDKGKPKRREMDIGDIYGQLEKEANAKFDIVHKNDDISPEISNWFESWIESIERRYKSQQILKLNARLGRMKGRLRHLTKQIERKNEQEETIRVLKEEARTIEMRIADVESTISTISTPEHISPKEAWLQKHLVIDINEKRRQ